MVQVQSGLPIVGGPAQEKTNTKPSAHGIQHPHLPLGEFLHQGLSSLQTGGHGAADSGGERDVQDILTRSQNRTEGILHLRGRDQGCFDHAFVPKEIVVLMTVKILGIGGAGN